MVTVDGDPVEVDTRKAIALLVYLTVEGSADREALAALLWADSSPERARATLRRTLSALRGGVGTDVIRADRNRVELETGFRSDVDQFDSAIEESRSHGHDANEVCERCIAPLSRAADLYRGDFLGAFAVRDAPDFEDWARPITEAYRLRAGEVFHRLAMAYASTGDYPRAIETAGRWMELDELHEPAHRMLMLLNAWAGDRPGAIQAYRRSVAVLDRELGVAPLEETTELYEAILDEDLPPAPGVRRRVVSAQTAARPGPDRLLDRADAVAAVEDALERARDKGRLCVITGPSWMGKTRLLEHLADRASDFGYTAVSSRAFRAETNLPYGVAMQLLDTITALVDPADLPPWALEELARLDPRLAPGHVNANSERLGQLRLREAFLTLVAIVAQANPLLITVDDAQWIDAASASLLAYLARRVREGPVLVVISSRDVGDLHPALSEIETTADDHVQLKPLTTDDLSDEYPDTDVARIIEETGGIPLLVQEALESGGVTPYSANVTKYLDSRLQRLSGLGRQILTASAVLDGMCDPSLLRDTGGRTDEEVVEAVEELVGAGLLREEPDGRLEFTLDVLETVTYESTSLTRRRLLHRRAATALETRARSHTDARLSTAIARHLRAAGSDDAAEWYRLSGDLARAVFANDEAMTCYETAIALGHRDIGGLHLALGELAMARGDYQNATVELRAAAAHSTGPVLALVEHRIGDLNRILGRFELAQESFERAHADHPEPSGLFADWALLEHRIGHTEAAMDLASKAREAAERTSDEELTARALNILAVVDPDPSVGMDYVEHALEISHSNETARMAALNNKAHLLAGIGQIDAASHLVDEAIEIADRAGYRHHQAALLNHLADLHHRVGREREAEESLTAAVKIFADIDSGDWEPEVWLLRQW